MNPPIGDMKSMKNTMKLPMKCGVIMHDIIRFFRRVIGTNDEIIEDSFLIENHALMMYQPFIENNYLKGDL